MRKSSRNSVFGTFGRSVSVDRLRLATLSLFLALLLLLLSPLCTIHSPLLFAQSTNASVSGQVTDQSHGVVPDTEVEIKSVDTGVSRATKTNKDGFYSFPNVPPGKYLMNVRKQQFRSVTATGIELHVQDNLSKNFELQVGSVDESVTVTAEGNNINTTDGTVSTTIDRNFAENLPLNGRSFQALILLTPGVALTSGNLGTSNGGQFSVNGQRSNANDFTVDGVSADVQSALPGSYGSQLNGANPGYTVLGTTQSLVPVDALQEFKIQTSTYAPEFGRQPGGQVSLLTRSGTNDFHGTGFDYLRNTVFDANNWFNDQQGLPKGAEHQNDFGGTIGGPIFKDKTFFFFSYEGLRLLIPDTFVDTVPSLRLRQEAAPGYEAILNSWPIPDGPEFTTQCDPATDPACPPSLMEPTGGAPYTFSQSQPINMDSYNIKIDHTAWNRVHVFGRYAQTSSGQSSFQLSNLSQVQKLRQRGLTVGMDISIRPNLENELRLNYTLNKSLPSYSLNLTGGAKPFDVSTLFPEPLVQGRDFAQVQFNLPNSFFYTFSGPSAKFTQRQINVIDNVSHALGAHQIKWGIDYRRVFPIFAKNPVSWADDVNSESDIVAGNVSDAFVETQLTAHPIFTSFSAFAQDTWRATNRLSLTYGLRWELNPAPGERNGLQPLNLIGLSNPATATLAPLNSSLYKTTYNDFAPRVGLAYQLRQASGRETILRGGVGVFYDLNSETAINGFDGAPFQNFANTFGLSFPIPNNVLTLPPVPTPVTTPYPFIDAIDPNLLLPYTVQWNASVQQSLGQNQSVSASYVGSAGFRLLRSDLVTVASAFPNGIQSVRNASASSYNSFQLQFNRRFSHGFQALASYTYAHSIDNASNAETALSSSTTSPDFLNPNVDRGNSDFDLRHAFRGALNYVVPTWRADSFTTAVLGGWFVDTIGIAQTGLPVNLIGGNYFIGCCRLQLRPNLIPGIPLYLSGAQCTAANGGVPCPGGRAFNFTPGAVVGGCPGGLQSSGPFCRVPTDSNGIPTQDQGTLGRNVMRGFGAWQVDFAIHRQFNLTERVNLQFRAEFFNLFNHPNFGAPQNFLCGTGCFGLANSTLNNSLGGLNSLYQLGGPRSIQFALKVVF
jgi:hypothetical protein